MIDGVFTSPGQIKPDIKTILINDKGSLEK